MLQFEHTLLPWEWRDGEIKLSPSLIPDNIIDKRLKANVGTQEHFERKITKAGRIYFGRTALRDYTVGDILIIEINEDVIKIWKKSDF